MLGSVGGRFQGLDVMTALYLGGVPLDVAGAAERDTGIANGFVGEKRSGGNHFGVGPAPILMKFEGTVCTDLGCVSRLSIGGSTVARIVDLHSPTTLAVGVSDCDTCGGDDNAVCENGGVCQQENAGDGRRCLCRVGYSGAKCQKEGEECYEGRQ